MGLVRPTQPTSPPGSFRAPRLTHGRWSCSTPHQAASIGYFVPAADFGPHHPGVRTGSYRTSTTAQVTDEEGRSVIGVEDYAIAFADELDKPSTHRGWLAVGY
ncbi:hypothetical protein GCM10009789_85790 [Kribbella sancticallisti]|uniref:Uncharacterized protein n=1 Tax=Kribbella sancticallisti TaxID=460087 RepID=A0ABP4QQY2_9ACTN